MNAIEKSIRRHEKKLATKKVPPKSRIPWGCGMGWPEPKDFDSLEDYRKARRAYDPDYAPGHDGKNWMIV